MRRDPELDRNIWIDCNVHPGLPGYSGLQPDFSPYMCMYGISKKNFFSFTNWLTTYVSIGVQLV